MNMLLLKVLIIVTSHGQLGNTGKTTGYYLPEVTHPYFVFEQAGYKIDIASPQGGKAPMDESSLDLKDADNKKFMDRKDLVAKIENTLELSKINVSDYAAVFFAGGHGTMWDFSNNKDITKISSALYEKGGVVAAVCHGPAALLNVKLSNGSYLIRGKNVAGFTNEEENAAGMTAIMPFLLETELKKKGAKYSKTPMWQKHVVVSERLVTGQNPASAKGVADEVVKLLKNLKLP